MSDMIHGEKTSAQPEVGQQADRKRGKGLSFPSVASMGIAVFLVVLMMIYLGWEIANLNNKKAGIDTERRLLERDKAAYSKVLEELPGLEDRRQNLSRELDELKGKVQSNQTFLTNLTTQKDAALSQLDKAKAANKQIQEETNAARETSATLQGEIRTNRPVLQNLKQNVHELQAEEKTLRTKSNQLQNETAKLQADVSGLEKQKRLFEELSRENGALTSLSKRFGTIADGLEASRKGADGAIQGWKTQTQSLSQISGEFQKEIQNFSKQTQALSTDFGDLTTAHKELQSAFKIAQQVLGDLQSATKTLSGGAIQIQKSADFLDKETQRFSQTVDGPTNNLQTILPTLSKGIDDLGKAVSAINGHVDSLQTKIGSVDGATSRFLETSKEVGNITKDLSTARSGLVSELAALKELNARLQAVDQALKIIEKRFPQEPTGEKGQ